MPSAALLRRDAGGEGRPHGHEEVLQVEAAREGGADRHVSEGGLEGAADAREVHGEDFGPQVSGLFASHRDDLAAVQFAREAHPVGVLEVHHGRAVGVEEVEEALLGLVVGLHGLVEVQVVAGEVREARGREVEVGHPGQGQGVGGDLHGGVGDPLLRQAVEPPVDEVGLGGGAHGGEETLARVVFDGPEHPGAAGLHEDAPQEVGAGGLPVGARDPRQLHGVALRVRRGRSRPPRRPPCPAGRRPTRPPPGGLQEARRGRG